MINIKKSYKKHFLEWEFFVSLFVAIVVIMYINALCSSRDVEDWIIANKKSVYPLIATISGTLLGFVITGVSIIIAFSESEKLKLLKKSKQYKTIFEVYFSTIKFLALTTVMAVIGLILDDSRAMPFTNLDYNIGVSYIIFWLVIISSFRIYRCLWILENIVEIMHTK